MRAAFRNLARRVSDHFGDVPEYEVGRKCFVMYNCLVKKNKKLWLDITKRNGLM